MDAPSEQELTEVLADLEDYMVTYRKIKARVDAGGEITSEDRQAVTDHEMILRALRTIQERMEV